MGAGAFLVALAGPVARRVLASLGIGLVVFAGAQAALDAVLSNARAALGGFVGDAAALFALAGGNVAASIIAGALVARVSMMVLKRFEPR
jgi:hypothetical protein